jgi:hypothetical protein
MTTLADPGTSGVFVPRVAKKFLSVSGMLDARRNPFPTRILGIYLPVRRQFSLTCGRFRCFT